ncbi:MAG: hypothetical protein ABSD20_17835 [Terriglobales bacterium]|jgi:hypothetical protein
MAVAVFVVIILCLAVAFIGWWEWQRSRVKRTDGWPTAEATIESGAVELVHSSSDVGIRLPVFAFSYKAAGEFYSGRFALLPYIVDPGPSIVERMLDRKLLVRFDPNHPESWIIPDKLIEGCKVEQKVGPHLMHLYPTD